MLIYLLKLGFFSQNRERWRFLNAKNKSYSNSLRKEGELEAQRQPWGPLRFFLALNRKGGSILFIPSYTYQNFDRTNSESNVPLSELFSLRSESIVEEAPISDIQWEDVSIDYRQENGFFKGLLIALPVSLLSWAFIISAVRGVFLNFGGGFFATWYGLANKSVEPGDGSCKN